MYRWLLLEYAQAGRKTCLGGRSLDGRMANSKRAAYSGKLLLDKPCQRVFTRAYRNNIMNTGYRLL